MERRQIIKNGIAGISCYSLFDLILRSDAVAAPSLRQWIKELHKKGQNLIAHQAQPREWQEAMDTIYQNVPLADLCKALDLEKLLARTQVGARGEKFVFAPLIRPEHGGQTVESRQTVITKVAIVKGGKAIPPHGHQNMVSAFLVLKGKFKVQQYHKIKDIGDHLIVRPARNEFQSAGKWSSVSDQKTNIHWLKPIDGDGVIFSTKVVGTEEDLKVRGRIYIDLKSAKPMDDGNLRAPVIGSSKAFSLYG